MKLKAYRDLINKTQRRCAEELDITVEYFSDLERGVHEPGRKLLDRIYEWSNGAVGQADMWG